MSAPSRLEELLPLITRAQSEYLEMPGLHLSFAQACRLWQMDTPTCKAVLNVLVRAKFLQQTPTGGYVLLSTRRVHPPLGRTA